jgi:hypothetical protein
VAPGVLQAPMEPEEAARRLVTAGLDLLALAPGSLEEAFGALTS